MEWSAGGKWLAAAGGSALLVITWGLQPGEPPIRCVVPGGMAAAASFGALSWCPVDGSSRGSSGARECLLAAIEAPSGRAHLYSVAPEHTDGGVPRHAAPLLSVDSPGLPSPLAHVAFATSGEEKEEKQEPADRLALVVAHGDWTTAVLVHEQTEPAPPKVDESVEVQEEKEEQEETVGSPSSNRRRRSRARQVLPSSSSSDDSSDEEDWEFERVDGFFDGL